MMPPTPARLREIANVISEGDRDALAWTAARDVDEAADFIEARQWVPVAERMPEKDGMYLVCDPEGYMFATHTRLDGGFAFRRVTHWQPLPPLPPAPASEP